MTDTAGKPYGQLMTILLLHSEGERLKAIAAAHRARSLPIELEPDPEENTPMPRNRRPRDGQRVPSSAIAQGVGLPPPAHWTVECGDCGREVDTTAAAAFVAHRLRCSACGAKAAIVKRNGLYDWGESRRTA